MQEEHVLFGYVWMMMRMMMMMKMKMKNIGWGWGAGGASWTSQGLWGISWSTCLLPQSLEKVLVRDTLVTGNDMAISYVCLMWLWQFSEPFSTESSRALQWCCFIFPINYRFIYWSTWEFFFDKASDLAHWEHRLELLHQPITWGMVYIPPFWLFWGWFMTFGLHYLYASGHEKMEGHDDYCKHQIGGAPYV